MVAQLRYYISLNIGGKKTSGFHFIVFGYL